MGRTLASARPAHSFVVSPQSEDLHGFDDGEHLIDHSVLDIDPPGVRAGQIAHQFFKRRRVAERVLREDLQELDRLRLEATGGQLLGVFLGLFGVDQLPDYHGRRVPHRPTGVSMPARMESLMPGIDSRNNVSWIALQSSSDIRIAFVRFPVMWMGSCDAAA